MLRLYLVIGLGVAVAIGAAYGLGRWQGYRAGISDERAAQEKERRKLQQELFDTADKLSEKSAEIERLRSDQSELAKELEHEARQDPNGRRPGIGPDGLRRLERRWQAAP